MMEGPERSAIKAFDCDHEIKDIGVRGHIWLAEFMCLFFKERRKLYSSLLHIV